MWRIFNSSIKFCSIAHPQIDGWTKVTDHVLERLIWILCGDKPKQWDIVLPQGEFAYNCMMHSAIWSSPFSIIYVKIPHPALDLIKLSQTSRSTVMA